MWQPSCSTLSPATPAIMRHEAIAVDGHFGSEAKSEAQFIGFNHCIEVNGRTLIAYLSCCSLFRQWKVHKQDNSFAAISLALDFILRREATGVEGSFGTGDANPEAKTTGLECLAEVVDARTHIATHSFCSIFKQY